jgi:hypothetical protein
MTTAGLDAVYVHGDADCQWRRRARRAGSAEAVVTAGDGRAVLSELESLLDRVRALGLPTGDFVLFGSAPLLVRGIVPPTGDVDVLTRGPAWEAARGLGPTVRLSPYDVEVVRLHDGRIEIGTEWGIGDVDVDELIDSAEVIAGLPFARLPYVRAYKELADRPKDREHLRLLDAWESDRRA